MKSAALLHAFTALAAFTLTSCGEAKKAETSAETSNAPEAKPGLSITDGTLSLPAVPGNPGAAYFALTNSTAKTVKIANISIKDAGQTEMHQTTATSMNKLDTLDVAAGSSVRFEPGKMHVMVFGIDPKIQPHANTEMTVTFADGDKVSAPLMAIPIGTNPMAPHAMSSDGKMDHMEHQR